MLSNEYTAGRAYVGDKTGLIDDYAGLAAAERKRIMDALKSEAGFESQDLRNREANRNFVDDMLLQRYQGRPQMQIPGMSPGQGPSTGQRVANTGRVAGDAFDKLSNWFAGRSSGSGYTAPEVAKPMDDEKLNALFRQLGWSLQ